MNVPMLRRIFFHPWSKNIGLFLYYALIVAILIFMYADGNFSSPEFIYQGF